MSIDAMGTQREIAELILDKKGHYLPAVKGNRKSLYEDMECAFKVNGGFDTDTTPDKDHGRIEVRKCSILPAEEYLLPEILQAWKGLGTIIKWNQAGKYKERKQARQGIISVTRKA